MEAWLQPKIIWFMLGVILLLAEFALPSFFIFFFGIASIIVSLLLFVLPMSLNTQILLFIFLSLALVFSLRKYFVRNLMGKSISDEKADELNEFIGKRVTVIEKIPAYGQGKVEFNGSGWSAESEEELEVGEVVQIEERHSTFFKVKSISK